MALTGSNVAFGKAIVTAVPVYVFVLLRFIVASLALAPMAPKSARLPHSGGWAPASQGSQQQR